MTILLAVALAATSPSAATTLRSLRSAADCLVRKDRVGAADLAFAEPGSPEEASVAANLKALPGCAKAMDTSRVADAVAAQLTNELITSRPQTPLSAEEEAVLANAVLARPGNKTSERAALHCLAELRPEATGAFIRARPDTREERSAVQTLLAAMPHCVPAGVQVSWAPVDFRLALARTVYRTSAAREMVHKGY